MQSKTLKNFYLVVEMAILCHFFDMGVAVWRLFELVLGVLTGYLTGI